jgi:starch-binding outer membrane protein, SusD/RagB family
MDIYINSVKKIYWFVLSFICLSSCKKLVDVGEPVNSITTVKAFDNDANAISAVMGIYSKMINTNPNFGIGSGALTIFCGLAADELNATNQSYTGFSRNDLLSNNVFNYNQLWSPAYFYIYEANACIEGLQASSGLNSSLKLQLLGEAKFIRAFCYFYLTNLYGDLPLVLSTDWNNTAVISRASKSKIYDQIILDLKDAENALPDTYLFTKNERSRPIKFAATALLARVYLYLGDYSNAEIQSTQIINKGIYNLDSLSDIFKRNSGEAIWQLRPSNKFFPNTVLEGYKIIPNSPFNSADFYVTDQLLNSFEVGDKRKASWIDSSESGGIKYYYPSKYKIKYGTFDVEPIENYTVLRLAEQYLIRAEARANGAGTSLSGAIADLSSIRTRAGLSIYNGPNNKDSVLKAIEQENKIEFFAELGHRWLDLKRTNQANTVLGSLKGANWQTTDQIFPIPVTEINKNPKLSQNEGY